MFNTLFQSVFKAETFRENTSTLPSSVSFSLSDILAESSQDETVRIEITTLDAPNSISVTISPPPSPNQMFVMIPLSIDIPVDNPTRPKIRLHSPSATKSHRWNPKVFDEEKMAEQLLQTHDIPSFMTWLYKRMQNTDNYLMERSNKRSRHYEQEDTNHKSTKMEVDE